MCVDPEGTSGALQFLVSLLSYIGIAVVAIQKEDIRQDMNNIGWNPFNSDESAVLNSSKVSFYKGVPVFIIKNMGGSMSLGAIFFDKSQGVEVLKHERGHNDQFMSLGFINYLVNIGIPSVWKNADKTPWELSASLFGGSGLASTASRKQKEDAMKYFSLALTPTTACIWWYIFYV